jgi:hypothetical protein
MDSEPSSDADRENIVLQSARGDAESEDRCDERRHARLAGPRGPEFFDEYKNTRVPFVGRSNRRFARAERSGFGRGDEPAAPLV